MYGSDFSTVTMSTQAPENEILSTKVVRTYSGGKKVY